MDMQRREKLNLLLEHISEARILATANQVSSDQFKSLISRIRQTTTVEVENARLHEEYPRNAFYIVRAEITAGITPETNSMDWDVRLEHSYQVIKNELDSVTD